MIDLQQNERVVLNVRRHWFVIFSQTASLLLFAVVPLLVGALVATSASQNTLGQVAPEVRDVLFTSETLYAAVALAAAWLLLLWILFFIAWTNYYLDVLVITDKRVIDIEQVGLFSRDVATIPIANIQDVKFEVKGIIPTMLHFGDLHIQTAGAAREVVLQSIQDPEKVKATIMALHHGAEPLQKIALSPSRE